MPDISDRVGVQLHLRKEGTPYYDLPRVIAALKGLGVGHVRDSVNVGWTTQNAQLGQVADEAGVKLTLTVRYSDTIAGFVSLVQALGDRVAAVEGVNEWDNTGRPGWATELRAHHAAFYTAVKAALPNMPVIAPSLANPANAAILGPVSCDYGNSHAYPNGAPGTWIETTRTAAATVSGGKPLVVTETGYTNATHDTRTVHHHPINETDAASYIEPLLAAHASASRVFIYELFDQGPGDTVSESCFGLIRNDGTPKPAYDVLRQALIITRRTDTSDDARCTRCPGVMVLWADRDKHTTHLT